tara:strand:- start:577 stop:738 length:162 start_codon:yes stop_codon:yes gene_type:complete
MESNMKIFTKMGESNGKSNENHVLDFSTANAVYRNKSDIKKATLVCNIFSEGA